MAGDRTLEYLTAAEARFLDSALARLIPSDDLGPGAKEADVATYIDRELASTWGVHGRCYRMGPWREGTPQQGYQSRLTPQELYREAIRETNEHCVRAHGKPFHALTPREQDAILSALESGALVLDVVSSRLFFKLLWQNTQEGFFADPLHGGNKDKIGWRLIGFPGVGSGDYTKRMSRPNMPYRVEPVSVLDLQQGGAAQDSQGFAKHTPVPPKDKEPR
jgi:gluconate 2-dehydrogenase gamma chain